MIADEVVEQVQDAADIVAIVSEHVKLKRVGGSWRGPCPFHSGKGDNFSVLPGKGFRCFVCGETGSVFTFVQKHLGMDFVEAVKLVGEKSGIVVEEVQRRKEGPDPRTPLWEVVGATLEYFERMLWEDDEGQTARTYLAQRGITREVADRFRLGYAPKAIGALRRHLEVLGFDIARQIEAGVQIIREPGDEPRPRFRGRLMFPIHDPRGNAVGFGGRSIDGAEPKYLNSSESPIFHKGQLLYNLHAARHPIRKAERVLVVEGYFDVVRTVAAGIEEVVAPLGTALTIEQAQLMRRYSNNVFLLYDSDQAGLKATFRSGDVLLHEGAAVRVVSLPEGDDPDTFVAKQGAAGLEHELRKAVDVFDRKLQLLERGGWFADLHKARKAIDRLLPTIRAAVDPLTRDLYLSRAAQVSQVDRETLAREAAAMPDPIAPPPPSFGEPMDPGPREEGRPIGRTRGRPTVRVGADAERMLLRAMLLFRGRLNDITTRLDRIESEALDAGLSDLNGGEAVTFRDATLREIHSALVDAGADVGIEQLAEAIPEPMVPALEELTANAEEFVNLETIVEDNLITLEIRWRDELRTKLWEGRAELDTAGFAALTQQRDRLKREIMTLQARRGKRAVG